MKTVYLSLGLFCFLWEFWESVKIVKSQQLNFKAELKASGSSESKTKRIDSLLQSFVDQNKVSSVVGFVKDDGTF